MQPYKPRARQKTHPSTKSYYVEWQKKKLEKNPLFVMLQWALRTTELALHRVQAHSFTKALSESGRLLGACWQLEVFTSTRRCSIAFRSADWLGHCNWFWIVVPLEGQSVSHPDGWNSPVHGSIHLQYRFLQYNQRGTTCSSRHQVPHCCTWCPGDFSFPHSKTKKNANSKPPLALFASLQDAWSPSSF